MIGNLQLLRGLAALGVVFYHTGYLLGNSVHTQFSGVSIFFVISGFIMVYVTRDSAKDFLKKRLVRICPLYAFLTLFSLIYFYGGFANLPAVVPIWGHLLATNPIELINWFANTYSAMITPKQIRAVITTLIFFPTAQPPVLGVGWTLNIEMYFYFVFWLCLLISKKLAPLLASTILVGVLVVAPIFDCGPICNAYGHDYVKFFIFGFAIFYVWKIIAVLIQSSIIARAVLSLAAIAILLAWPFIEVLTDFPISEYSHHHYYLPPLVVLAFLTLHSAGLRINNPGLLVFGAASYALYLSHTLVIETIRTLAGVFDWLNFTRFPGLAIVLIVSVIVGLVIHVCVELPVLSALTRLKFVRPTPRPPLVEPMLADEAATR